MSATRYVPDTVGGVHGPWAAYMDPYILGYLARHSDFSTTQRYVHPQAHTIIEAIERARNAQGGHNSGHKSERAAETPPAQTPVTSNDFSGLVGRGEWIRTTDLLVPNWDFRCPPRVLASPWGLPARRRMGNIVYDGPASAS
jgi:hypothetical protein